MREQTNWWLCDRPVRTVGTADSILLLPLPVSCRCDRNVPSSSRTHSEEDDVADHDVLSRETCRCRSRFWMKWQFFRVAQYRRHWRRPLGAGNVQVE